MRNIIRKGLLSVLCIGAVMCTTVAFAGPAKPDLFEHIQPDGSVIYARLWGDEFYNFIGDEEGYLLVEEEDGGLSYVTVDNDAESILPAKSRNGRPYNAVKGFDVKDRKLNFFGGESGSDDDDEPLLRGIAKEDMDEAEEEETSVFYTAEGDEESGIRKQRLLIVIPEYDNCVLPDMWTKDRFNNTFFSTEAGVYSVANYYTEVSGGRVTFVPAFTSDDIGSSASAGSPIADDDITDTYGVFADGIIRVRVEGNHPNGNLSQGKSNAAVKKILAALDPYIDISKFSGGKTTLGNNDMSICFFMPGYEMSGTSQTPSTWAHKTHLASGYATSLDGVKVCTSSSGYIMIGCRDYNNSKDTPSQPGVFCHELGHLAFKLPDQYNTVGGSEYSSMTYLSLMSSGSWGRYSSSYYGGAHPTHLDAWSKYYLGWYDEDKFLEVDETAVGEYNLVNWLSEGDGYNLIKINTTRDSEYYLLENRRLKSFDRGLRSSFPYPGVALYRVDRRYTTSSYISGNSINNTETPGVKVLYSGKGLSAFYASNRPMWYKGSNRLSVFGKSTFSNNALNTPITMADPITEVETLVYGDSGVGFEVLSASADVMKIKLGMDDLQTGVYSSDGQTKMYLFNNTDCDLSSVPFLAEYKGNSVNNLIKYDRLTVQSSEYGSTSSQELTVNTTDYKYKNILMDFPKFDTYKVESLPPEEEEPTYDLTLSNTELRGGAIDGMTAKEGSWVLFNILNTYVYQNNGYLADIRDVADGLVALKVNKGTNVFSVWNNDNEKCAVTVIGLPTDGEETALTSTYLTDVTASAGSVVDDAHATVYNTNTAYKNVMEASTAFSDGNEYVKYKAEVYYTLTSSKINGSTGYSAIFGVQNGSTKKYISIFDNGNVGIGASGSYKKTDVFMEPNKWNTIEICSDSSGKALDVYINGILAIKGYTGCGTFTKGFSVTTGVVNNAVYYSNITKTLRSSNADDGEVPAIVDMGFRLNTNDGLANMKSGETAVVNSMVEFARAIPEKGNEIRYFNNDEDITSDVDFQGAIVLIPITAKGDNKIKAVEYNGTTVVRETGEIVVKGIKLSGSGSTTTSDEAWQYETKYAEYLKEGSTASAEEKATARKLYGYVNGEATRKPARGTGTSTSSYKINLETNDYLYVRMSLFIDKSLTYETPSISRWGSDYIRLKRANNHILINDEQDSGAYIRANEWEKIELYADGDAVDIYINGVLKGKKALDLDVTSVTTYLGSSIYLAEQNLYVDRASYYRGYRNIEE